MCPHCGVRNQQRSQGVSTTNSTKRTDDDDIVPKLVSALPWVLGVFFILAGLGTLTGGGNIIRALVAGMIMIATGAFSLPPVREHLEPVADSKGIELSRGIVIVVVLVGIVAGTMIAPTTEASTTEDTVSDVDATGTGASSSGTSDSGSSNDASNSVADSSGSSISTFAIRVQYSGSWSSAASVSNSQESTSQSYSGTGTETIEITGEPDIISANAQKKDGSSETLIIQILEDGEVIGEASTSSEYGVAQTSTWA